MKEFEENNLNYSTPFQEKILGLFLYVLISGACGYVLFLMGCRRYVVPPVEQRMFFPQEVTCRENPKGEMVIQTPAGDLYDFVIVGGGRFYEDNVLLNECEAKGLIEKRKNK